ncbi:MAG TPA: extracellular solute-binding protein [Bacilli bacterium]
MVKSQMRRDKWVSLIIILSMVLLAVGCSKPAAEPAITEKPPIEETPAATAAATEEPPKEPVEITIWDKPIGNENDPALKFVKEAFADFEAKYPHIKVNHEAIPTGETERQVFVTAMAGGSGPDAYSFAHFPVIGEWVKQGLVLDLTPYWNEYADKDQYTPAVMGEATIDGKIYGLPHHMYVMGLAYRKHLFTEAGLDPNKPPATWDEFVDYAKKLTKPEQNQVGYALLGMEWADWFFEYYVWQAGGDLTTKNADGTVTLNFTSEPVVKALQYWKDLKWTHKVVQKNVVQGYAENHNDFFNNRAAMILFPSDAAIAVVQNGIELTDIGFAPFPAGPAGKNPSQVGGSYWIINPQTSKAKQDAAWLYITYMLSKEMQEKSLLFTRDSGQIPNILSIRKDVDPSQFITKIPKDLVNGVAKAAENVQLEYFLKERLGTYITKAIQKVLLDEKADIRAELQAAQDLAQREVADPYNQDIKK